MRLSMQMFNNLFTQKMWAYFRTLTHQQQNELINRVKSLKLALKINPDPEFIEENVEKFLEDYPIVKDCMKDLTFIVKSYHTL